MAKDSNGETITLGPLLSLLAEHIDAFVGQLPPEVRKRFDHKRKFSDAQVREIRASTDKIICIAAEYGVAISTVSQIRTRKAYRWVQ